MGSRLGLHTKDEQERAWKMAQEANHGASTGIVNNNPVPVAFQVGYIKAIHDLAVAEGATKLAQRTGELYKELDATLEKLLITLMEQGRNGES